MEKVSLMLVREHGLEKIYDILSYMNLKGRYRGTIVW